MLFRSVHRRLALLALLAAMLLVVMPTMSTAVVQGAPQVSMRMDASMQGPAEHAAMAGMSTQEAAHRGRAHPAPPQPGLPAHGQGDCAYCPLLAGLLQWRDAAIVIAPMPAASNVAWMLRTSPAARRARDAHAARGPPALHAA